MPASTVVASRIAGRFVVESVAGVGGMGTVYRAHDEQTGQTVALKLIHASDKAHVTERFVREAELLAELRHPGIVAYLAHGVIETGESYLAMEWLEGEVLSRRLARGALSLPESLTLLRRAAEALALAHERGVVHRDLKPSNLLLRGGRAERVALLDFGIARLTAVSQVMTRTGMVMGTPGYMAPEQARGERDVTPAADVFSLGCVLFECLTGQPPFAADHLMAVLARIFFDEPPKLRRVRPEMPEAVEALLEKMLAKSTADRLPDAAALLAALDDLDDARSAPPGSARTATAAPGARAIGRAQVLSARAPSVGGEQHLLSVLMAMPPAGVHAAPSSPDVTMVDEQLVELHREVSDQGIRLEALADGSLVATLRPARGAATDHAARAARCALFIKARWPEAVIALSTGRGLVDEHAPVGEVFDRAAALLRDHAGAPLAGQILIDDVTRGLLEVRFVVQRAPGGAYTLTGEELALDASRPLLGKPTPCVGRDVELGMLEAALAASIEDAEPRAVLVTAPPGAGKSRLRHEFLRRVEAREGDRTILIGCGDPMSAGSSYSLLGHALRRWCGIQDGESPDLRRRKLALRIGERFPASARERVAAFIGELCGVPFPDADSVKLRAARQDPQLMSDQITRATLDLLRAECAERPVLLVLEDLHWGDALTVKLVEEALRKLAGSPLMVLALARPEVDDLFPRLWTGIAQVAPLRPLGKKASERLLQQVLGAQVPEETASRIVEQSEGNALFLEELIRAVAEGRGDEAPGTVLAILQARIGRLPSGARRVLRAASVFGETAWLGGIQALLGGAQAAPDLEGWLARLTQDDILEERPESRFLEEKEHMFRHALMRDAAYGLLTANDRVEAHRIAGQYLEERGEPDARVLAEHFVQGEAPARAIPYFVQAAEQSFEAYDMTAAMASAGRGLACGAAGEQRGALLSVQLGVYHGRERYPEIVELGAEALDLLPEGSKRWCSTTQQVFPALAMMQRGTQLAELAERFARIDPPADARGDYIKAATWLSTSLAVTGRKDASCAFLERARQVGAGLDASYAATWGSLKAAEYTHHHVIEEAPWSRMLATVESREALRSAGDLRFWVRLSSHHGTALLELGERAQAEVVLRESLAVAERLNDALPLAYARTYLALLLAREAKLAELDEPDQLAGEILGASSRAPLISLAHGARAETRRRRGDLVGAEEDTRRACETARPFPAACWGLVALRIHILLALGRAPEALQAGDEAVQWMDHLGLAGHGEIALRLALAEAQQAAGQGDAARAALADVVHRLKKRADDIPAAAARERYLTQVPVHARLIALAKAWLGIDVR